MGKPVKTALGAVLVLIVGLVAADGVAVLFLDAGVKSAVETGGSYALKVPMKLDSASVSLVGGKASLKGLFDKKK
jgi:hypothetical protein